jgi:hypothetical protein
MTASEREAIARLTALVEGIDERLGDDDNGLIKRVRLIETYVAGREAIDEREASRGVSRRAYIAAVIAAIGVAGSVGLGIANLLT